MATQEVTLNLPAPIYDRIKQVAEKTHRSVDDLLLEAVVAAAPALDEPSIKLRSALAQLAYLNDAALWQVARSSLTPDQRERLEALHDKQQREELTAEERQDEQALMQLYRESLLVRAQAAMLLKQRGYDVADPQQFAPLV
jgi:uncharacterized protein YnzC (UPF0291/DUF896 family)